MPTFTCDLSQSPQHLEHHWEHTVGSGHAPLALRADWQRQLERCHQELGFKHVRFHGLLSDPMNTLIDHGGELLYSFFNADQIMDFLLSIGMRPFVELSFMPAAIAAGSKTVFSYRSIVTPPTEYAQWASLMEKLISHWTDRYGVKEVRRWFFEVWNEPNIEHFWTGTQDDYFRLYRHTVEAIKGVDADLRVGGPATAANGWIEPFLNFCDAHDLAADFVTTHYYPTDAFGEVGAPTEQKLADSSPDIMARRAQEAHESVRGRPLYYTEWNIASNPRHRLHDMPFAAAFATYIIMTVADYVQGYSFWTFSDIFEELYFPSEPFHGGFGLLTLHGVPKPVYRAFQLLHRLGDRQYTAQGEHETVTVWPVARRRREGEGDPRFESLTLLMVNLAMPQHPIQTEIVELVLEQAPHPAAAWVEKIDAEHANPRRVWEEEMDRSRYLQPHQVQALAAASQMRRESIPVSHEEGTLRLQLSLPPQSVAAVTVEFA